MNEVAAKVGVSRPVAYQHEAGGFKNPPAWIVRAYAELYGKPTAKVLAELTRPMAETGSREKRRMKHTRKVKGQKSA